MSAPLSAEQLAERTRRATAAARDAAIGLGLRVERPTVLHDAFSVVVRLDPEPVVARIPVVSSSGTDPGRRHQRQQRELDVSAWLAAHDVAVVRPAAGIPRTPVQHNGFAMTFWELADVADDHAPYRGVSLSYSAQLHAGLAGYPGPLPFLAPFNDGLSELLGRLTPGALLTSSDIDRVQREFDALRAVLADVASFRAAFPDVAVQPIQGDVPSHNVIRTRSGILFGDFEDVCLGPVEWDVALLGEQAVAEYDAAARARGLRALDPAVLRLMDRARRVQFLACVALVDELPLLATGLAQAIEEWRTADDGT